MKKGLIIGLSVLALAGIGALVYFKVIKKEDVTDDLTPKKEKTANPLFLRAEELLAK